jgi:serine/threonine protein phosphatase 1
MPTERPSAPSDLPDDQPVVVVGDSHGHVDKVERLVAALDRRGVLDDHRLVFLGDYLDRGPEARALVERCIDLRGDGHVFLCGNHEHVLVEALRQHESGRRGSEDWVARWSNRFEQGVLRSYGVAGAGHRPDDRIAALADAMPAAHRAFLESLPWFVELDGILCVHAGIDHGRSWDDQRGELVDRGATNPRGPSWLYSHDWAANEAAPAHGATLVTGHKARREAFVAPGRVMIDTGSGDFDGALSGWISSTGEVVSCR